MGTLHVLAVNSVQSLYNYYSEQLEHTPSLDDIRATNKMPEKTEEHDEATASGMRETPDQHHQNKKEASNVKKDPHNPQVNDCSRDYLRKNFLI